MTITELTNMILATANSLELVHRATHGDIYEKWNAENGMYGAFNIDYEGFAVNGSMLNLQIIAYYGDRVRPDGSNELPLYDDAVHVLSSIFNGIDTPENEIWLGELVYVPFRQTFADDLAGAYVRTTIQIPYEQGRCSMDD